MRFAPFGTQYTSEPAETWQRILAGGHAVSHDPELGLWLITGHDTVRGVLADTTRFSNAATLAPVMPVSAEAGHVLAAFDAPAVTTTADGPQHARIRAVLRGIFPTTAARAELAWGALVARRADQLAGDIAAAEATDLMPAAIRFSLHVITDVLVLPTDQAGDLHAWTDAFARLVWAHHPETQVDDAHEALALWHLCSDTVTARAQAGGGYGPGVIGDLLRYRGGDDARLSVPEAAAIVLTIAGAGWETTAGALGHALEHALIEPGRWTRLGYDEHALATHVEETLRHSPAIDGWLRVTTTDVDVDGTLIPAGSRCLLLIGAANHDPAQFAQPRVFNPGRARLGQHLAFGAGAHYCIGAALARLELSTALRTLARRLPALALAGGYRRQYKPSVALRQHTTMPATTGGGPDRHSAPAARP
ncbi:cytochrome P450 [Paractinoplanes toevensis]|uniref:Cytochrome P450 n=1 Tax=Paractinoplanes toevensis TaxID=571911 RepID=A0A919TFS2_9ACTN|nr:cytochrome P450 [Actinoplanes toevensis]GIM93206.1 cytochrome P450 [Actinoplanes toevensis]